MSQTIATRVMTFASHGETIDAANFVARNVGLAKWESQTYDRDAGRFTLEVSATIGEAVETALREGGFEFAAAPGEARVEWFEDGFYTEAEHDAMMAESEEDWIDRVYEAADADPEPAFA